MGIIIATYDFVASRILIALTLSAFNFCISLFISPTQTVKATSSTGFRAVSSESDAISDCMVAFSYWIFGNSIAPGYICSFLLNWYNRLKILVTELCPERITCWLLVDHRIVQGYSENSRRQSKCRKRKFKILYFSLLKFL